MKLVVDASAWIEYLGGTPRGSLVETKMRKNELFTTSITVAEVIAKARLKKLLPETAAAAISSMASILPVDAALAQKSGLLYAEFRPLRQKFSLSDAITLAAARQIGGKVLTLDIDFAGIPDAIVLGGNPANNA